MREGTEKCFAGGHASGSAHGEAEQAPAGSRQGPVIKVGIKSPVAEWWNVQDLLCRPGAFSQTSHASSHFCLTSEPEDALEILQILSAFRRNLQEI